MRILINTPYLSIIGGVAQHYKGLQPYWTENVRYNQVGKRKRGAKLQALLLTPYDIIKFFFLLLTFKPDVVLLNPSMNYRSLKRDAVYLKIAQALGFKVAIMFHGFHSVEVENQKEYIAGLLNRTSLIMVLASEFRNILLDWGVKTPIKLVTTKVEDSLVESFDIQSRKGNISNVLYLARVTTEKGIFVSLKVFSELAKLYSNLKFTVVGEGPDLESAQSFAEQCNLRDKVSFKGALSGQALKEQFTEADCYLFTSYHEGMPSSVLEAMAFGLPVVTRPVGGLKDIFEDGKMGYVVDSDKAEDYLPAFAKLIGHQISVKKISEYNHHYAQQNLMASAVAKKLEQILQSIK